MNDLRDLGLFVAVAEARSFTRAAVALGVPTSSLSRRVAALESSLGVRLLQRNTRVVSLTEAGALYLARGRGIVEAAEEARAQVRGLAAMPQGLLRLSVEAELGPRLIAPVVSDFLVRYPAITFEIDLSPRRVDLLGEQFDLAIRLGRLPDSGLTVRRLALLQAGLYAAPAYLDRRGEPIRPSDLAAHARIRLLHQGDDGAWHLTRGGEAVAVGEGAAVSANNMTMIRQLARLGVGIAVLDELMAREDVAAGALRPVLPGWTMPPGAVSVLTPNRLLPVKTRLFVDLLAERITGLVGLAP